MTVAARDVFLCYADDDPCTSPLAGELNGAGVRRVVAEGQTCALVVATETSCGAAGVNASPMPLRHGLVHHGAGKFARSGT
jgi:hypothetical protein